MKRAFGLVLAAFLVVVVAASAGVPPAVAVAERARQWGTGASRALDRWVAGGVDVGPGVETPASPDAAQDPPAPSEPRAPARPGRPRQADPAPTGIPDGVRAALDSVVQVLVRGCGRAGAGSGFVVGPGRVLTNAHVVRGADAVVVRSRDGTRRPARVVLYDPAADAAVLDVAGLEARALPTAGPAGRGTDAWVAGHPSGGPLRVVKATVLRTLDGRRADQQTYVLRTVVRPGNSGGPLFDRRGRVLGLVFARAADGDAVGYARTWRAVADEAADGRTAASAVRVGSCP
jgi:S1-C subfamily serine protease